MRTKKRFWALLLTVCLIVGMLPQSVFATEGNAIGTSGLCEHHTVHDEACGYVEGIGEGACTYEHGQQYDAVTASGNDAVSEPVSSFCNCDEQCDEDNKNQDCTLCAADASACEGITPIMQPATVEEETETSLSGNIIYVGGVAMEVGEYLPGGDEKTEEDITNRQPDGGYAYYYLGTDGTPILELNNYSYEGMGHAFTDPGEVGVSYDSGSAIYSEGDLQIHLIGENNSLIHHSGEIGYESIRSLRGDVNISGSGTLTIESDTGIYARDITVSGGSLNITARSAAVYGNRDVEITGGSVNITTISSGITGERNVEIAGGSITVNALSYGINGTQRLEITGGNVEIVTKNYEEEEDYSVGEGLISFEGDVIIRGGSVTIKADSYGIQAEHYIEITGGNVEIDASEVGISSSRWVTIGSDREMVNVKITISSEEAVSKKGILAESEINIEGKKTKVEISLNGSQEPDDILLSENVLIVNEEEMIIHTLTEEGTYEQVYADEVNDYRHILIQDAVLQQDVIIYIGDVEMKEGEYLVNNATQTTYDKPDNGGYAYFENGVLTLKDFEYIGEGYAYDIYDENGEMIDSNNAVIYCGEGYPKISLEGENSLVMEGNSGNEEGIRVENDLIISGSGKLTIDSPIGIRAVNNNNVVEINAAIVEIHGSNTGIYSNDLVKITNSRVDITSENGGGILSYNIEIEDSDVRISTYESGISGGTFSVNGGMLLVESVAAYAMCFTDERDDSILLNNGKILLPAGGRIIEPTMDGRFIVDEEGGPADFVLFAEDSCQWDETFTYNKTHHWKRCMEEGCLLNNYPAACNGYGEHSTEGNTGICSCGYHTGQLKEVFVGGKQLTDGKYLNNSGELSETEPADGGYAYYRDDVLTLNNYKAPETGYYYEELIHNGGTYLSSVYSEEDLTIRLVGENILGNRAENSEGITMMKADLAITGEGRLKIEADNGIYVYGDVIIQEDGPEAGMTILNGKGNFTVEGGTLEIRSFLGDGIYADGRIHFTQESNLSKITITCDEPQAEGIDSYFGGIFIEGGSFDIRAGEDAVDSEYGPIIIEEGELKLHAVNGKGIDANHGEDMIIRGGTVIINAPNNEGIDVDSTGKFLMTGGKVTIEAGEDGIDSELSVDISGGSLKIKAGENGIESVRIKLTAGMVEAQVPEGMGYAIGKEFEMPENGEIILGEGMWIVSPVNGSLQQRTGEKPGGGDETIPYTYHFIADGNGRIASHVKLQKSWGEILPEDREGIQEMPQGIWIAGIRDLNYNGTKQTQNFRVYDGIKLLKEGTDYTISYKNNQNASTYTEDDLQKYEEEVKSGSKPKKVGDFLPAKAPQVVIKMKGDYKGTKQVFFRIKPYSISSNDIVIEEMSSIYNEKKVQQPKPVVSWKGKALKNNKDYTFEVSKYPEGAGDVCKIVGEYTVTVTGTGNFTGTRDVSYKIVTDNAISKAKVKIAKSVTWEEIPQEPSVEVTYAGEPLSKGSDYSVDYIDGDKVGTAYAVITGEGKYSGSKVVSYKVTGTSMAKVDVDGVNKDGYPYTGEEIKLPEVEKNLKIVGKSVSENDFYTVSYQKNIDKGTATMVLTGDHEKGYSGTKKITYKISARSIKAEGIEVELAGSTQDVDGKWQSPFMKGGSKPKMILTDGEITLVEGKDFSVSYKNNKTVDKTATATIKGKGNYKDSITIDFLVMKKDLSEYEGGVTVTAKDLVVKAGKKFSWKQSFQVVDEDGKALTKKEAKLAEAVYTITALPWDYAGDLTVGKELSQTEDRQLSVPEGSEITITVELTGDNYQGTATGSYRLLKEGYDISKASIIIKPQEYTGRPIEITSDSQFKNPPVIKVGKKQRYLSVETKGEKENLQVVEGSYVNNVKKGTAKVTLRGVGEYGGEKTVTFKIVQKDVIKNWWEGITKGLQELLSL